MKRHVLLLAGGLLVAACFASFDSSAQASKGGADGFAAGTTGGDGGTVVRPTTLAELEDALCSNRSGKRCMDTTRRVIVLDRIFDFRGSVSINGSTTTTEKGCLHNANSGAQDALDRVNYCSGRPVSWVTYDNAGPVPLTVGSNKTILGVGRAAGIKGRGLRLADGNRNIIVQNISITDINPRTIWGGDALTIDNARYVWIDHNYFARIGRQMIVTGFGSASSVSITNNVFDGTTRYSATNDGQHYWLWLFLGREDTITLARNYVKNTSGRGPHAGGMNNADVSVHMVNNYFENSSKHAANPLTSTAYLLLEGNYFDRVARPVDMSAGSAGRGNAWAQFVGVPALRQHLCSRYLGRSCVPNDAVSSGSADRPLDESALVRFNRIAGGLITPKPASYTKSTVRSQAGTGMVN